MKRSAALSGFLFGWLLFVHSAQAQDALVLVVDRESPIESLTSLEIRKAYLSVAVTFRGTRIRALRNGDDERLNAVFLQTVVGMTKKSYERRLLSTALKYGNPRPVVHPHANALAAALVGNATTIAYMWQSDADALPSVRVVKVLWREQ